MTIQELLAAWSEREKTFMGNIAIATHFFAARFSKLQGTPEEYGAAFSALSRLIPWQDLINYEISMREAVFETTALYASKAGDAPCACGPSTRRVWNTSVAKACRPFRDGFTMPTFVQSMLAASTVPNEYKLDFCRQAHPNIWCDFVQKEALLAVLASKEHERLAQLPWNHVPNRNNIKRTANIALHQQLVATFCPQLGPLLVTVLPQEAWQSRDIFLGAAAKIPQSPYELPLPEEFAP